MFYTATDGTLAPIGRLREMPSFPDQARAGGNQLGTTVAVGTAIHFILHAGLLIDEDERHRPGRLPTSPFA